MLTFGNRSLMAPSAIHSIWSSRKNVRCLLALLSFFVHEIIKRDKYSGKHFDLTNFYCEEFAERSETTSA